MKSVRARFITVSVSITVIALGLFFNVINEKAISYKHYIEKNSYRVLVDQLVAKYTVEKNLDSLRTVLRTNIKSKNQPAILFAIISDDELPGEQFYKSTNAGLKLDDVVYQVVEKNDHEQGLVDYQEQQFFWLKLKLPETKNSQQTLLAIFPFSTSNADETLQFFGTPLYISGVLLLWLMVWASIILSSLVTKLEKQKQKLSNQSADIEKARDEALQANQAKSSFLANMSHEIRTPLSSIIGFAESSLDANQTMQERYEATRTIIRSGRHLLHLINEILDISKIEAGKLDIEYQDVVLVDLLKEVNQFVKVLAQEKGLTFGINSNFPLPGLIHTDPYRLKQILLNLCSNAIKFTEKGHVYINVSYLAQNSTLKIEVVDTGVGMTEDQQLRIFKPFQQADSSITRKYGGTGLGLTLSRQLCEMLNGELTVVSTPGKGSHFYTMFKINEVNEKAYIYQADYESSIEDDMQIQQTVPAVRGRILMAEDNPDIQKLLKMYISKTGAELIVVNNGQLAIDTVKEEDFDLIFLDIQMPVMGGLEAVKQMQESGITKPIVAMTANAMQQDKEECMKAGFDGFISKPVIKNDLYAIISQYLEKAESDEQPTTCLTSSVLIEEPDIIELVDEFIKRLPELVGQVNESYQEQDWDKFSALIHQIKGVGGAYGYNIVTKLSEKIEFLLTSKDYSQIKLLLDEMNLVCKQIKAGKEENYKIVGKKRTI